MLDVAGRSLCSDEEVLLRNPHVGGVILFSRNLGTPEQVIDLVCEIRACSSNLLIAVDQEGGRVQRLCEKFSKLPTCLLYTSPSPRDRSLSRMPSSA